MYLFISFFMRFTDDVLKSRETPDMRGGGGLGIDWVSLLAKHKDNIPFIVALFGALPSSRYLFIKDQLSHQLFQAIPGNWYSLVNNRYLGAIDRAQTVLKEGTKKIFYLSNFLEHFKLSNKKIVKVKQDLIFLIQEVVKEGIIQNKIRLVHKNNQSQHFDHDKLNPKQLNRRIEYLIFYKKLD